METKNNNGAIAQQPCEDDLRRAEGGDAKYQNQVGMFYQSGRFFKKDILLAVKWHTKAALQGYLSSYGSLARMYYRGDGIEKDYSKAVSWFKEYASLENYDSRAAMFMLGKIYYQGGSGVIKNNALSAEYFEKLAQKNFNPSESYYNVYINAQSMAMLMLGKIYNEGGCGINKNKKTARQYFIISSGLGNEKAYLKLIKFSSKGVGFNKTNIISCKWFFKYFFFKVKGKAKGCKYFFSKLAWLAKIAFSRYGR